MKDYKMNFNTRTLTITKEFAKKAMIPGTEESEILKHLQSICPGLNISYKTRKPSITPNPRKGLTFAKMERYIRLHDNASELLVAFSTVKAIGDTLSNKYNYVYNWFMTQFPDYGDIPEIKNGKIVANIVSYIPVANDKDNNSVA